jgi:cobalt-zinc-cadmium efflux system membrane fusion protein
VFEKDLQGLKTGQRINFVLSNLNDKVYQAFIKSIGKTLMEDVNAVRVLAVFQGSTEDLYPGMFVSATIHAGEDAVPALPESAVIIESEENTYIFYTLSDPENDDQIVFEKAMVVTGRSEEGFIGVTVPEGLPPGAQVVTEGSYYIKSEMMKSLE